MTNILLAEFSLFPSVKYLCGLILALGKRRLNSYIIVHRPILNF